jgi:hypothetical protein
VFLAAWRPFGSPWEVINFRLPHIKNIKATPPRKKKAKLIARGIRRNKQGSVKTPPIFSHPPPLHEILGIDK